MLILHRIKMLDYEERHRISGFSSIGEESKRAISSSTRALIVEKQRGSGNERRRDEMAEQGIKIVGMQLLSFMA